MKLKKNGINLKDNNSNSIGVVTKKHLDDLMFYDKITLDNVVKFLNKKGVKK